MKRSLWFLLAAAILGLLPSITQATAFQASEISTLNLGAGTGNIGGLLMLQNTGYVITTSATGSGITYTHHNPNDTVNVFTGFVGLMNALSDGRGSAATQGITSVNLRSSGGTAARFYAVGYANNNDRKVTSWGGVTISTTGNLGLLRETWMGDANMDGKVDSGDYIAWSNQYLNQSATNSWLSGDFNSDGKVDSGDYIAWSNSYLADLTPVGGSASPIQFSAGPMSLSAGPLVMSGGPTAVPEPSTLALCLAGAVGLLGFSLRRFRKSNSNNVSQTLQGSSFMRKCFLAVVAIATLAAVNTARAEIVMTYSLVVDSVWDSSSFNTQYDEGNQYTLSGTNVSFASGIHDAYVRMAVVATISNSAAVSPSTNGINSASMNFIGSQANMGGASGLSSAVNGGDNRGLSYVATPLYSYAQKTQNSPVYTWAPNFTANGYRNGAATTDPMVIGYNGPSADIANAFVAAWTTPATLGTSGTQSRTAYWNTGAYGLAWQYGASASVAGYPNNGFSLGYATTAAANKLTQTNYLLGELDYSIVSGSDGGTASVQVQPLHYTGGDSSGFKVGGQSMTAAYNVTNTGDTIGSGAPITFTMFGELPSSSSGTASLAWDSSIHDVLSGGTVAVGGTISNNGTSAIAWTVSGASSYGTVDNATGSVAANNSASTSNIFHSTPSTTFGRMALSLTPTGTASGMIVVGGGTINNPRVNVIGHSDAPIGTAWAPTLSTLSLLSGADLANLQTTMGTASSSGITATSARILAGTLSADSTVSMKWRSRTTDESASSRPQLVSDIVNLTSSTGTGLASNYVLQMTYDPSLFTTATGLTVDQAITKGLLYLATKSGSSWVNATVGNQGAPATPITTGQAGTYAAALAGHTLADMLGSWGIDTAANSVWAVVNHEGDFAAVPEPGTLALLAAGAVALGLAYRRRKSVKA